MESNAFMIRPPTSLPPDQPLKPLLFACDELLPNRFSPMPRKKSAPTRPRTGNRRNPLLHQAIIDAATEVLAKEGPIRFTIEAVAKLAGCGKPTIYRWWPSRSALLLEVYEQSVKQELVEPEGKDLAKDLAAMLRKIWGLWRKGCTGSLYRLILSEMMLEEEGARYLRDVFIPRRQAFTGLAFQAAIDRGEIPPETDIKLLLDFLYGYSVFRLMTRQIDDDPVIDRVCAAIAKLARSGVPSPVRAEKRPPGQRAANRQ
jgi:AcrR family transcriptional regulator